MSDKSTKELRGQVRQIVKEILPEVLKEQLYAQLKDHVDARMNEVQKYITETMDLMNVRQKSILRYLVESYKPGTLSPEEAKEAEAVAKTEESKS